jgi:hypothetical protein
MGGEGECKERKRRVWVRGARKSSWEGKQWIVVQEKKGE